MKTIVKLCTMSLILFAAACDDTLPTQPELSDIEARRGDWRGAAHIGVLSRNLYIGFNVDETIAALATPDPNDDALAIQKAVETLVATDFPTRAGVMADEVARLKPDFLGLQEVYELDITIPGLPAIHLPFLEIFRAALSARGLDYVVAAENTLTNAQLPGISLIDHDVLLVNATRVEVHESAGAQFSANLGDPFGIGVDIVRGWTRVRATVAGDEVEVWNTHPEPGPDPAIAGLRAIQMGELAGIASTDLPVIVMGDLNDEPGSQMYNVMIEAGFADVWAELRPRPAGYTCCHADDLSNERVNMDQRIDYVMARGFGHGRRDVRGSIGLTGVRPWERVPGPYYLLWPSDHAGVYAELLVVPTGRAEW